MARVGPSLRWSARLHHRDPTVVVVHLAIRPARCMVVGRIPGMAAHRHSVVVPCADSGPALGGSGLDAVADRTETSVDHLWTDRNRRVCRTLVPAIGTARDAAL